VRILPPHDGKIFAEFAENDCPRCVRNRRVHLVMLLIAILILGQLT
jgi:hypothetical protein